MSDPRICIVGAGALSSRRIYPYIGAVGGQLAGVCDLDAAKAEKNAVRFGGKVYKDLEKMLAEQKPDGVMVCVGPAAHAKLARRVLELGYPVYTEKPPAPSAEEAWQIAHMAKKTGLLCTTAFKKRYTEAATRAKKWLEKFPAQDRLSLSIDYCSGGYANDTIEKSFLLDFGIHVIDLAAYLFGDVETVFAFAKGMNAYAVSLRFAGGAVGSLNLNDGRTWGVPTEETELTVKGGNFMTIHNSSTWRVTEDGKPGEWREPCTTPARETADATRGTSRKSRIFSPR
ncbi:MAG TPA: Gfo/Idh/MocA family oxidoreductase [Candidatus Methylacidiphilales bacterium]|jgi:myo-inositol 2-dehydrogenase/D-chiro-inositol 1-dehydrogenase|nr:Gfo/Idh/MocA family oxidoreductase [Candidatus Methylacidiphilales bacterium]